MNRELIDLRIKSFMWEAASLLGTALATVLLSPEFRELIMTHFGQGVMGSVIVLVVIGIVKHVRNLNIAKKIGADSDVPPNLFI